MKNSTKRVNDKADDNASKKNQKNDAIIRQSPRIQKQNANSYYFAIKPGNYHGKAMDLYALWSPEVLAQQRQFCMDSIAGIGKYEHEEKDIPPLKLFLSEDNLVLWFPVNHPIAIYEISDIPDVYTTVNILPDAERFKSTFLDSDVLIMTYIPAYWRELFETQSKKRKIPAVKLSKSAKQPALAKGKL